MACHFSNRIPIRSDPHNPNTLGYRFLREAMNMWHHEYDNLTLTNVQAGLVLSEVVSVNGMDNLGWMLFQTAVDLLKKLLAELELSKAKSATEGKEESALSDTRGDSDNDEKMERAISATVWATFRLSCIYSLLYKNRPLMGIPTIPLPEDRSGGTDTSPGGPNAKLPSVWRPYPYTQPSEPDRTREGIRAFCGISLISYELCDLHTTEGKEVKPLTVQEKTHLYQETAEWKDGLPEGLRIGESNAPFIATSQ
ncbi:hypothetical protein TWF788_006388 [Orbilia oligospora]|uniref:Transcription factor domain-containing protein n=1 Tax=Orbilia oligospora TaxID=2813651 RepID=A0A7C8U660_ORBOL|nr:hypothetical protein TWF788_006388 [Orbilia oligospora]